MDLQTLRAERERVTNEQKRILDKVESEGRDINAYEQEMYDRLDARFYEIQDQLSKEQNKLSKELRWLDGGSNTNTRHTDDWTVRLYKPGTYRRKASEGHASEVAEMDFGDYCRKGLVALNDAQMRRFEQRALQMDKDTIGGFLVAPETFVNQVLKSLFNNVFMRQFSTLVECKNAHSLGVPYLDSDPGDPTWTAGHSAHHVVMHDANLVNSVNTVAC